MSSSPGAYVDHRLRTVPASERARDAGFQAEVPRDSRALLALATDQGESKPGTGGSA